jgi:hypothetical protein
VGRGFWKPLEIRLLAAATHGHRVGHAALDDDGEVASSYFLFVRIFCSIAVASMSPAQPSGFVPGWDWGGATVTKQAAGEFLGLDRVCEAFCRVQVVKVRGLGCTFFFRGPPCKSVPTAGMNL